MSLHQYKLKNLGDKIREQSIEPVSVETVNEVSEPEVVEVKEVKEVKKRRLNK